MFIDRIICLVWHDGDGFGVLDCWDVTCAMYIVFMYVDNDNDDEYSWDFHLWSMVFGDGSRGQYCSVSWLIMSALQ